LNPQVFEPDALEPNLSQERSPEGEIHRAPTQVHLERAVPGGQGHVVEDHPAQAAKTGGADPHQGPGGVVLVGLAPALDETVEKGVAEGEVEGRQQEGHSCQEKEADSCPSPKRAFFA
jgi:hypothetical protein